MILRCLLDASRKLEHQLQAHAVDVHTLICLRMDVYDLLLRETSDRGKETKVLLDWTDPDLLRELLRRRFVYNGVPAEASFEDIWRDICASHVYGEETSQFLIERCLMRPRYLLDLFGHCSSYAINLRHTKIEVADIEKGLAAYSGDLVTEIGLEIGDVLPEAADVLYAFIDVPSVLPAQEVDAALLGAGFRQDTLQKIKLMLLWYAVLGVKRRGHDGVTYVYDVNYDLARLEALANKESPLVYTINPAFWTALDIRHSH